jgi:hypothetical protein
MAYTTPTKYTRGYDFTSYQTSNPADPLPASSVDSQLDNIATHYNKTVDNLVVIQRSDGKLANDAVHIQTFDTAALALIGNNFTPKGDWATGTAYVANDMVEQSGNVYIALEAHTSSAAFSTDDAKWQIIANSSISTDAATVENFTGTGSTSVFTTSVTYQSANNAQVFVNGALVRPTTDYTLSGTTLTFTAGYGHPPSSATILIWGVSSTVASITTSVNSASASATAAAASLSTFQGQYHGAASSDPVSGLDTGDLYFNTSDNIMKTYNGSAWVRIQPTTTDQAHINTVSGISANVTSVAGKETEVGRLGTADAIADLAVLGTADVVADMNVLATADVVTDMNTLGTADVVADMNTLGTADVVTDMNVLATADVVVDMNTLATAANVTAMNTLGTAANVTNMATNATNIANINLVAADATDIGAVAGKTTEIGRLGTADAVADMNTLGTADVVSDMNTLASAGTVTAMNLLGTADAVSDMNTLATADVVADMNTLGTADVVSDMNTLGTADVVSDMNTLAVADVISDMNTLATADIVSDMNTLGTSANVTAMDTVATNIANVNTTATNIADVNAFSEIYRISSSAPDTSLDEGDLWWDSASDALKVRTSSAWYDPVGTASTHATNAANSATSAASQVSTLTSLGHFADWGDLTTAGSPTDYGALT